MVEAAPRLAAAGAVDVTHQTGERDVELVRAGYRSAGLEARVEPFLYAMDREMKSADVVVSRAGATTIAELAAVGRAAVLVPLPTAADDHQKKNAEVLAAAGAAELIEQKDLTGAFLADRLLAIANPTTPEGEFYRLHKRNRDGGVNKIQISAFDTPNVKAGEIIVPGLTTREWVEEMRIEWGEDSALWKARVLGEFPDVGDNVLVPPRLRPGAAGSGPRYPYPTWDELRQLSGEERRLILDYFRRLNDAAR